MLTYVCPTCGAKNRIVNECGCEPRNMAALRTPSGLKFSLGHLSATPGALQALRRSGQEPGFFLSKHVSGDWGECDAHDAAANDLALEDGSRIFSVCRTLKGEKLWIITEADRSVTTLLLPEEY
jgi:hypothetical protein